jgi:hypothetical protein
MCGGSRGAIGLDSRFSRDFVLTIISLFWFTQTMPTSLRDYYDNRRWQGEPRLGLCDRVLIPTAIANFTKTYVAEGEMPIEWAERLYDIRRWTTMPRGGHFAAAEEPRLLAADVAAAFAEFGRSPCLSGRSRKSRRRGTGENKPKPLPAVAPSCRSERMVRRGRRFESVRGLCKSAASGRVQSVGGPLRARMEPFMELSRRDAVPSGVEGESPQPVSSRVASACTRLRCGSRAP